MSPHDHGYGNTLANNLVSGEWVFSRTHDLGTVVSVSDRFITVQFSKHNTVTYSARTAGILIRLNSVRSPRREFNDGAMARCNELQFNPHPIHEPMARAAWFAGWLKTHQEILKQSEIIGGRV